MTLPFIKMHGAGNDFIVFDARQTNITLTPSQLETLAARRTGIGCDQVVIMEPSSKADVFMRIYNADGSQVNACGNASRCVAWLVMEEAGRSSVQIETLAGVLTCMRATGDRRIRVDMGEPELEWQKIPLSRQQNLLHLEIAEGPLSDPLAVGMGNPHMVFVVHNVDTMPVTAMGPVLEHHPLFPERANVSFAQVMDEKNVKLRVWERGAGETLACGTAACATLVGLTRRGMLSGNAAIELPGGILDIEWDKTTNHVWMTGPVALTFRGTVDV